MPLGETDRSIALGLSDLSSTLLSLLTGDHERMVKPKVHQLKRKYLYYVEKARKHQNNHVVHLMAQTSTSFQNSEDH